MLCIVFLVFLIQQTVPAGLMCARCWQVYSWHWMIRTLFLSVIGQNRGLAWAPTAHTLDTVSGKKSVGGPVHLLSDFIHRGPSPVLGPHSCLNIFSAWHSFTSQIAWEEKLKYSQVELVTHPDNSYCQVISKNVVALMHSFSESERYNCLSESSGDMGFMQWQAKETVPCNMELILSLR